MKKKLIKHEDVNKKKRQRETVKRKFFFEFCFSSFEQNHLSQYFCLFCWARSRVRRAKLELEAKDRFESEIKFSSPKNWKKILRKKKQKRKNETNVRKAMARIDRRELQAVKLDDNHHDNKILSLHLWIDLVDSTELKIRQENLSFSFVFKIFSSTNGH